MYGNNHHSIEYPSTKEQIFDIQSVLELLYNNKYLRKKNLFFLAEKKKNDQCSITFSDYLFLGKDFFNQKIFWRKKNLFLKLFFCLVVSRIHEGCVLWKKVKKKFRFFTKRKHILNSKKISPFGLLVVLCKIFLNWNILYLRFWNRPKVCNFTIFYSHVLFEQRITRLFLGRLRGFDTNKKKWKTHLLPIVNFGKEISDFFFLER